MSVIYKAISNIDAAEGVRRVYPGGEDPAAARRGVRGRGGTLLLAAAVALGLGGAAALVVEPAWLSSPPVKSPATPSSQAPAARATVEPGEQDVTNDSPAAATANIEPAGAPIADHKPSGNAADGIRMDSKPAGESTFVFEPAQSGNTAKASDVPRSDRPRTLVRAAPAPARTAAAAPETVTGADTARPVSDPRLSVERQPRRQSAPVTVEHARRVRMLSANLRRALQSGDTDEIARILDDIETLVGPDSSYMLKMRAYTELKLGGDTEHAMSLLREVLVRDPGDEDAVLNMAVAEIGVGEVGAARDRLQALAVAHPGDDRIDKLLRSIQ